ncbi:unnamed protein product [Pieris macdunnoughi]|uniref:Uncharacterized protein n=1 Tax=Pieris macdunnoughi TaxID=345717 RepID=A0A821V4I1_9NEOP|nr:unnamed protein product [Pieris macdunnoughi]
MGNSKSKKMKISTDTTVEESHERINTIKTESLDNANKNNEVEIASEQIEEKNNDNASSASTVEVLDDK